MQMLTKEGAIEPFDWLPFDASEGDSAEKRLLPPAQFVEANSDQAGLLLSPETELAEVAPLLENAALVAIDFPAFADGRGFSLARSLRESYQYTGKMVAVGHFMQDQLFYLKRCGFDGFAVEDDSDFTSLIDSLNDFSETYQAACDQPTPLFRRRTKPA